MLISMDALFTIIKKGKQAVIYRRDSRSSAASFQIYKPEEG